ncbi:MAG: Mrp/NBP35 family ATP-binding protein [Planctomycetota bacterium]
MFGKKKNDDALPPFVREATDALRAVRDPAFKADVVTMGFVSDVAVGEGRISARITLPTPSGPIRDNVRKQAEEALRGLGWDMEIAIEMKVAGQAAAEAAPRIRNVIAVASGKGGVGKSTVAVNLALALKARGRRVGVLDADIYGPSIPHMLGAALQRPVTSQVMGKDMLVPVERQGLRLMSMGFLVDADKPVIWRGPMVHGALKQFFTDVIWDELDDLVIDLPPGTGDAQLTMVQSVPVTGAVIVTTPQDVAMIDARKAFNMFRETNVPVLGIVENMSVFCCPNCDHETPIFGEGGAARWADQTGVPFLGRIPIHIAIREHGDDGRPAFVAPDTPEPIRAAFTSIAGEVLTQADTNRPPEKQLSLGS